MSSPNTENMGTQSPDSRKKCDSTG